MKVKTRNFLISFLMLLTLVFGVFAFMPTTTTAKAASEVEYDRTVEVTTFAKMKEALEAKEDTHVIVRNFEEASGRSYYPLIYGIDYEDMSSEDIGYKAVITTPGGYNKRLTIHGDVDIRATDKKHPILNFILNKGNLVLDGEGSLHVDFNAGAWVSSIIFNMGELTVNRDESSNRPLTLNAEQKTFQTHGYAIYQYGNAKLTINAGNFIGYNDNMENAEHTNSATAIYINDSGKGVVINGGTFSSKTSVSHYVCYGITFDNDVDASKIAINGGEIHGIRTSTLGDKTLHPELTTFLGEGMKAYKLSDDTQMSASTKTTTEAFYVLNPNNVLNNIDITIPYYIGAEYALPTLPEGVVLRDYGWTHGFGEGSHTTIRPNIPYTAILYLNPAVGYTFGKNPIVTVNGKQVTEATLYDGYNFRIDNTFDELYYEPENIAINVTGYDVGKLSSSVGFTTGTAGVNISQSGKVVNGGNSVAIQAKTAYSASFVLTPKAGYTLANVTKDDIALYVGTVNGGTVKDVIHNSNGSLTVNVTLYEIPVTVDTMEFTYQGYIAGNSLSDLEVNWSDNLGIVATGNDYISLVGSNVTEFQAGTSHRIAVKFKFKPGYELDLVENLNISMAGATYDDIQTDGDVCIAYFTLPACPNKITLNGFEVDIKGVEYGEIPAPVIDVKTQGIIISDIKIKTMDGKEYKGAPLQVGTDYYVSFIVDVDEESGYELKLSLGNNEQYKNIVANYNDTIMHCSNYSTSTGDREVRFKIGSNSLSGTVASYGDNEVVKVTLYAGTTISYPVRTFELTGNNVEYSFDNLPSGDYQVWVKKDGHIEYRSPYVDGDPDKEYTKELISVSGNTTHNITLKHICVSGTISECKAGCSDDSVYYACVCGACYYEKTALNQIKDIDAFIAANGTHDYTKPIKAEEYIKFEATKCTESYEYWYACSRCEANAKYDEKATTAFYTVAEEKGEHNFVEKIINDAHHVDGTGVHCQSAKKYYYSCEHCDEIGTDEEPWVSEVFGDHIMNETYTQKDNQHYHACSVLGCDHTDTPENCSGGTATCQAKAVCDTCGNAYGDFAGHSHGSAWKKDESGHWNECVCGDKANFAGHNPDRATATEEHAKVCLDCGYIIEAKLGHTCGSGVIQNGQGVTCEADGWKDYYKCSGCEKLYEDEDCTILIADLAAWKVGDGKITSEGHKFGAWVSNGDGTHTRTCSVDNNHKEDGTCSGGTQTCTDKAICSTCNTEYGDTLTHSHGSAWETDEDNHWNECVCGDKANVNAHVDSDNNGKCDTCEYDMPTTPPDSGETPDSSTPDSSSKDEGKKSGCGGCGSAIGGIGVGIFAVASAGAFVFLKKRKDD